MGRSGERPEHSMQCGSACGTLPLLTALCCSSWYAANCGSYTKTEGTSGAAIGLMVWIWASGRSSTRWASARPERRRITLSAESGPLAPATATTLLQSDRRLALWSV